MRFIDEVNIEVRAGNGGSGCVAFRREKYVPKGGPNGGDGGRGGHVILLASTRKNTLQELYLRKRLFAKNGEQGKGSDMHGRNGEDIEIEVPVGTMVRNEEGELLADLKVEGERYILARGGQGGLGNARFKTSTNQAPRYAQPGEPGEEGRRKLELKVMADVGLVGLPNAGKSTFLARISNARPKVADYPFTTLKPILGEVFTDDSDAFVVADIPGLIGGAHEGKGLGMRFLRHVERTKVLLHLVDAASLTGAGIAEQIAEVEEELKGYGGSVWEKTRLLVINKIDVLDDELRAAVLAEAKASGLTCYMISAVSGEGVPALLHAAYGEVKKMRESEVTEE
ncbi:MAG: GTPase ObgE [Zetaproteobacteria bacterium CG06_land_8_20_14_3_00_59_53]|nr:MAG: GTPase ObgE [Zetaproteobacteria bacterium CG2_30_59_37]PIO90250.1 MAG: GTPase ObgE [Zetaproteobacteria bacterium CG23_combo_of_CG06-09_8_20_14_all_59_86]PIQ64597.1 MAG: GTPase ObgE [Zetaproteobacteria bacterium CG11_big_fil_rev_8_21_14_0_20_59_439]PIU71297.1 MAG: GTPase ObgE [Zetaproteobacteria bacterium CG06_land_8_20_14_3_00_59_53]PIU97232.1 MAG: GTPase ObgE [Zetaproteobacteria bacterium CG03_land_8_20_14_0_80_59_51]PIY45995.1 MAG: GTPase ObgE [Zetaproteobacteria bacterium CG_4_10_14